MTFSTSSSMPWILGLCLSAIACSVAPGEDADTDVEAPVALTLQGLAASAAGDETGEPSFALAAYEGVAESAASGGNNGMIPMPSRGRLNARTTSGDLCAWTVDGVAKGTSTVLDVPLLVGTYGVACKRADGLVASSYVAITKDQTTTAVLAFPGTLVAVAVNGSCSFYVNGQPKGTSSQLKLSLPPGAYTVSCKQASGAWISKSVEITSGNTAMAMFQL